MLKLRSNELRNPGNIEVLILCGGKGTRLQSVVNDRPKPMADIGGKPLLDWLIQYVSAYGFRRFVLCTGYMSESIETHYRQGGAGVTIRFSREDHPLGTGGAVRKAVLSSHDETRTFLVLNGDTFCRVDYESMLEFHDSREALVTVAMTRADTGRDHGLISLGQGDKIAFFQEKADPKKHHFANAGSYLMERATVELMPTYEVFSLETELFQVLADHGCCYGFEIEHEFVDIGTPERYGLVREKGFKS